MIDKKVKEGRVARNKKCRIPIKGSEQHCLHEKIDFPQCTFYKNEIESLEHLSYSCKITRYFWVVLHSWLMEFNINLEPLSVV